MNEGHCDERSLRERGHASFMQYPQLSDIDLEDRGHLVVNKKYIRGQLQTKGMVIASQSAFLF